MADLTLQAEVETELTGVEDAVSDLEESLDGVMDNVDFSAAFSQMEEMSSMSSDIRDHIEETVEFAESAGGEFEEMVDHVSTTVDGMEEAAEHASEAAEDYKSLSEVVEDVEVGEETPDAEAMGAGQSSTPSTRLVEQQPSPAELVSEPPETPDVQEQTPPNELASSPPSSEMVMPDTDAASEAMEGMSDTVDGVGDALSAVRPQLLRLVADMKSAQSAMQSLNQAPEAAMPSPADTGYSREEGDDGGGGGGVSVGSINVQGGSGGESPAMGGMGGMGIGDMGAEQRIGMAAGLVKSQDELTALIKKVNPIETRDPENSVVRDKLSEVTNRLGEVKEATQQSPTTLKGFLVKRMDEAFSAGTQGIQDTLSSKLTNVEEHFQVLNVETMEQRKSLQNLEAFLADNRAMAGGGGPRGGGGKDTGGFNFPGEGGKFTDQREEAGGSGGIVASVKEFIPDEFPMPDLGGMMEGGVAGGQTQPPETDFEWVGDGGAFTDVRGGGGGDRGIKEQMMEALEITLPSLDIFKSQTSQPTPAPGGGDDAGGGSGGIMPAVGIGDILPGGGEEGGGGGMPGIGDIVPGGGGEGGGGGGGGGIAGIIPGMGGGKEEGGDGGMLSGLMSQQSEMNNKLGGVQGLLKGGGAAVGLAGIALFSIMTVAEGIKGLASASPYLATLLDMFGMAISLFFRPFGYMAASTLQPAMVSLMQLAADFNSAFMSGGLTAAIKEIGPAVVMGFAKLLSWAVKMLIVELPMMILNNLPAILTGVIAAALLAALSPFIVPIIAGMGILFFIADELGVLEETVNAFMTGISAPLIGIYKIIKFLTGILAAGIQWIVGALDDVIMWLSALVGFNIKEKAKQLTIDFITSPIGAVITAIAGAIATISAKKFLSWLIPNALKPGSIMSRMIPQPVSNLAGRIIPKQLTMSFWRAQVMKLVPQQLTASFWKQAILKRLPSMPKGGILQAIKSAVPKLGVKAFLSRLAPQIGVKAAIGRLLPSIGAKGMLSGLTKMLPKIGGGRILALIATRLGFSASGGPLAPVLALISALDLLVFAITALIPGVDAVSPIFWTLEKALAVTVWALQRAWLTFEWLGGKIKGFGEWLAGGLGTVIGWFGEAGNIIGGFISTITSFSLPSFGDVGGILSSMIPNLSVQNVLSVLFPPLGVARLISGIFPNISVGSFLSGLLPNISVGNVVSAMLPSISVYGALSGMFAFINSPGIGLMTFMTSLFSFVGTGLKAFVSALFGAVGSVVDVFTSLIPSVKPKQLLNTLFSLTPMGMVINHLLPNVSTSAIIDKVFGAAGKVKDMAGGAVDKAKGVAGTAKSMAGGAVGGVKEGVQGLMSGEITPKQVVTQIFSMTPLGMLLDKVFPGVSAGSIVDKVFGAVSGVKDAVMNLFSVDISPKGILNKLFSLTPLGMVINHLLPNVSVGDVVDKLFSVGGSLMDMISGLIPGQITPKSVVSSIFSITPLGMLLDHVFPGVSADAVVNKVFGAAGAVKDAAGGAVGKAKDVAGGAAGAVGGAVGNVKSGVDKLISGEVTPKQIVKKVFSMTPLGMLLDKVFPNVSTGAIVDKVFGAVGNIKDVIGGILSGDISPKKILSKVFSMTPLGMLVDRVFPNMGPKQILGKLFSVTPLGMLLDHLFPNLNVGDFIGNLIPNISVSDVVNSMLPNISVYGALSGMFSFINSPGMSIGTFLGSLFSFLGAGIGSFVSTLFGGGGMNLAGMLKDAALSIPGMQTLVDSVSTIVSALVWPIQPLIDAGSWVFTFIAGILLFIREKILALKNAVQNFVDDPIGTLFGGAQSIWDFVSGKAKPIWNWITGKAKGIWNWITGKAKGIWNWISDKGGDLWSWLTSTGHDFWGWLTSTGGDLWGWITDKGGDLWGWLTENGGDLWGWLTENGHNFWSWLTSTGGNMWAWLTRHGGNLWGWLTETSAETWDWMTESAADTWSWLSEGSADLWNWLSQGSADLWNWVAGRGNRLWNWAAGTGNKLWSWVAGSGNKLWRWVSGTGNRLWNWVAGSGQRLWNWVAGTGNNLWSWVAGRGSRLWSWVAGTGGKLWGWVTGGISNAGSRFWSWLTGGISGAGQMLWDWITGGAVDIGNWFADKVPSMSEIQGGLNEMKNDIIDAIPGTGAAGDVADAVSNPGETAGNAFDKTVNTVNPGSDDGWFATGGVVDSPTRAVLGEGGESEAIVPFSKIPAFAKAVAQGQSPSGIIPGGSRIPTPAEPLKSESAGGSGGMGDMPMLEEGGIVTSQTTAMIGEGGEEEAVIPLSRMGSFISESISQVRSEGMLETPDTEKMVERIKEKVSMGQDALSSVDLSLDGSLGVDVQDGGIGGSMARSASQLSESVQTLPDLFGGSDDDDGSSPTPPTIPRGPIGGGESGMSGDVVEAIEELKPYLESSSDSSTETSSGVRSLTERTREMVGRTSEVAEATSSVRSSTENVAHNVQNVQADVDEDAINSAVTDTVVEAATYISSAVRDAEFNVQSDGQLGDVAEQVQNAMGTAGGDSQESTEQTSSQMAQASQQAEEFTRRLSSSKLWRTDSGHRKHPGTEGFKLYERIKDKMEAGITEYSEMDLSTVGDTDEEYSSQLNLDKIESGFLKNVINIDPANAAELFGADTFSNVEQTATETSENMSQVSSESAELSGRMQMVAESLSLAPSPSEAPTPDTDSTPGSEASERTTETVEQTREVSSNQSGSPSVSASDVSQAMDSQMEQLQSTLEIVASNAQSSSSGDVGRLVTRSVERLDEQVMQIIERASGGEASAEQRDDVGLMLENVSRQLIESVQSGEDTGASVDEMMATLEQGITSIAQQIEGPATEQMGGESGQQAGGPRGGRGRPSGTASRTAEQLSTSPSSGQVGRPQASAGRSSPASQLREVVSQIDTTLSNLVDSVQSTVEAMNGISPSANQAGAGVVGQVQGQGQARSTSEVVRSVTEMSSTARQSFSRVEDSAVSLDQAASRVSESVASPTDGGETSVDVSEELNLSDMEVNVDPTIEVTVQGDGGDLSESDIESAVSSALSSEISNVESAVEALTRRIRREGLGDEVVVEVDGKKLVEIADDNREQYGTSREVR